jgi:hypothetical protein
MKLDYFASWIFPFSFDASLGLYCPYNELCRVNTFVLGKGRNTTMSLYESSLLVLLDLLELLCNRG